MCGCDMNVLENNTGMNQQVQKDVNEMKATKQQSNKATKQQSNKAL